MSHTQGPWRVWDMTRAYNSKTNRYDGPVNDWRMGWRIAAPDNCHLATVGGVDARHKDAAGANARLMAAAPELLDTLTAVLDEFDRYDARMAELGRGHEDYGQQRADARALIQRLS